MSLRKQAHLHLPKSRAAVMLEWGLFQQHSSSEVLQFSDEHHSAKEIASILNISARTVEFHKNQIMDDLGLKSAAELIRFAVKHGIATQAVTRINPAR